MGTIDARPPVVDSVSKVSDEIAVGEDLQFQRKWWAFEKLVWSFFGIILLLTFLGVFGRGWLAKTRKESIDGNLILKYDRIQRTGNPSDITVIFTPNAVHDGQIRLFLSEPIISRLGAQRISPQPLKSSMADGGIIYSFPVEGRPTNVVVSVEPSKPGSVVFRAALPDAGSSVECTAVVVP